MRKHLTTWFLLLAAAGCAMAQPPAPAQDAAAPPSAGNAQGGGGVLSQDSSVDQILDALDVRGDTLQDFTANVELTETDPTTMLSSTRIGKVWVQREGEGDARLRVTLDGKKDPRKGILKEKIEYALDDGWLIDRDYQKRINIRRQVRKPGEQVDLFKLGEGPFPLPLGQDKADVVKLFEVTKVPPAAEDPQDTVHVKLEPRPDTQFDRRFKSIDVWVDLETQMPRRVETLDANGASVRTTDLTNIQVNSGLTDADLTLPAIDVVKDKWQDRTEAYEQ